MSLFAVVEFDMTTKLNYVFLVSRGINELLLYYYLLFILLILERRISGTSPFTGAYTRDTYLESNKRLQEKSFFKCLSW